MFRTNLKIAFRNLWKHKSFSIINIGGLVIGLASCLILLLYVAYEWGYNKQFANHDRMYVLYTNQFGADDTFSFAATPGPLAPAIQQSVPGVEAVVRTVPTDNLQKGGGLLRYKDNSFTKDGLYADSSFFSVFSYQFLEGNRQTALYAPGSIVLTQRMAQILFGKEDPLNKVIKWNNGEDLTVTGVVEDPPVNSWTNQFNYMLSWHLLEKEYPWTKNHGWGGNFCNTFLKLKSNQYFVSADKLTRKLIAANQSGVSNEAFLFPFSKWHLYKHFENGKSVGGLINQLRIYLLLAFLILLIACINFMNLSTARTQKRAKEVGVRKVVGSSRPALIRQFIGESALFVLISIIIAVVLVELSLPFFNRLLAIQLRIEYGSWYLWAGLVLIFFVTSLIAGSYPAFYLSSFSPVKVLKGAAKTGRGVLPLRIVLVVFQFVFTISLIIATAVIFLQIRYIKNKPVGYNQNNLLEIPLNGNLSGKIPLLKQTLLQSGVVDAACPLSISMTQGGWNGWGISWPGKSPDEQILFDFLYTGYDFAKTTGIHITEGRDFSVQYPSDSSAVLINTTAAKIMGLNNPTGATIKWGGAPVRVVGVFKDFVKSSPFKKVAPMIVGFSGLSDNYRIMAVRISPGQNLVGAVNKIEGIEKKLNPAYPSFVNFVTREFAQKFESEKTLGILANLFGGLAIFISCLGLFGLILFTTEQRKREIGIRKVLGASLGQLMILVSKDFVIFVLLAAIIACPIAYHLMKGWLKDFDYRITLGWGVFVFALLMALIIALISVSWQAWKSASANPVEALKYE